jgi:hypothetical protein
VELTPDRRFLRRNSISLDEETPQTTTKDEAGAAAGPCAYRLGSGDIRGWRLFLASTDEGVGGENRGQIEAGGRALAGVWR